MPRKLELTLTAEQRMELLTTRDHHPKPYMRERAAALLKVADGASSSQVAVYGLLKHRNYHTVCEWVHRYREDGLAGLQIRKGRGRKPAFSP